MTEQLTLNTKIVKVHTDRTSSSGTPYCALEIQSGDWIFIWEGHWKTEIENNASQYEDLEADIFVTDKEDDPDDHFYNLDAVVPSNPETAKEFFERNRTHVLAK